MEIGVHTMQAIRDIFLQLVKKLEDPEVELGLNSYERAIVLNVMRDSLEEMNKGLKGSDINGGR